MKLVKDMTETQYKEKIRLLNKELETLYYMFPIKVLDEEAHVMENLDRVSIDISRRCKKIIMDVGIPTKHTHDNSEDIENIEIVRRYNSMNYIYTGYNFDPMYKDNMFKDISNNIVPESIKYLNDEIVDYPIYFKLMYNPHTKLTGYTDFRVMGERTEKKIYITVNAAYYENIKNNKVFIELSSTVSHELQHVCDMYILPDRNPMNGEGNLVNDSFENRFNIPQIYLNIIKTINILCDKEEIGGRLAQLKQFITLLTKNKKVRDEMFGKVIRMRQHLNIPRLVCDYNDEVTEDMLVSEIYMNQTVEDITRLKFYKKSIMNIEWFLKYNKNQFCAYMIVIGFYLYHDDLLRMPIDKDERVKMRLLTDENTIRDLVDFVNMEIPDIKLSEEVKIVCRNVHVSIRKTYNYYAKLVNDKIKKHMHDFYTYEKVNNILGEDLEYLRDNVILYC